MTATVNERYTAAVAAEIRAWMGRRAMTQRALCVQLGVTPMWVSRRLAGSIVIDVEDLLRIAAALDVPISELLPRLEPEQVSALLPRLDSNQQPCDIPSLLVTGALEAA